MKATNSIFGLLALGANGATLARLEDPVLFTYGAWQTQNCSALPFDVRQFHQSDLSPSGCMLWGDFLGSDDPVVSVFVVETPTNGACQGMSLQTLCPQVISYVKVNSLTDLAIIVKLYADADCASNVPVALTSLHCALGRWNSFSLNECQ